MNVTNQRLRYYSYKLVLVNYTVYYYEIKLKNRLPTLKKVHVVARITQTKELTVLASCKVLLTRYDPKTYCTAGQYSSSQSTRLNAVHTLSPPTYTEHTK